MSNKTVIPQGLSADTVLDYLCIMKDNRSLSEPDLLKEFGNSFVKAKTITRELNLVEMTNNKYNLTSFGKAVVDSSKAEISQNILKSIIINYRPYFEIIDRNLKNNKREILSESVKKIWVKEFNVRLNNENLGRAVSLLFEFMEKAHMGVYRIGRGKNKSRFEITSDAYELFYSNLNRKDGDNLSIDSSNLLKHGSLFDFSMETENDDEWFKLDTDDIKIKIKNKLNVWEYLEDLVTLQLKRMRKY